VLFSFVVTGVESEAPSQKAIADVHVLLAKLLTSRSALFSLIYLSDFMP
jgi:hypothetical protein